MKNVSFNNKNAVFFTTLRQKVDEYFSTHKLNTTGAAKLYWKTIILFSLAVSIYVILLFLNPPIWLGITLCVLLGLNFAAIGFNVMHDGAHGSYSNKKWVNNLMGYSLNLMGGNVYLWKVKHNVNHHT